MNITFFNYAPFPGACVFIRIRDAKVLGTNDESIKDRGCISHPSSDLPTKSYEIGKVCLNCSYGENIIDVKALRGH
jgi:hypothetical protein